MRNEIKIYAVDLDKTLTDETCWTEDDCRNAVPNKQMVEYVRELHKNHHCIIIYSARQHHLYQATIEWLNAQNIFYSGIKLGKLAADYYIDDKAIWPIE